MNASSECSWYLCLEGGHVPYSEKYPEIGKNTDTVLYYSKRLVIDSLLAEFNQCYTEGRIDEIRQMLVEKEK